MSVHCGCRIDGLWANNERSNAWVWVRNRGWRKLDDRNDDACTNLLAYAAMAKETGREISLHEETRGGRRYLTEMYDFENGYVGPTFDVSFSVSECVYGWTAAYEQRGSYITVRVRLDFDAGISATEQQTLRDTWQTGIEQKWSNRFRCCDGNDCSDACLLQFRVQWVTSNQHHRVRVRRGPGRSNMTLWDTNDTGDVASHEFGHMLGHPDEYNDTTCPDRSPVNTGTVMDDNTEVVERLCEPFCDRHDLNAEPA
ncbi:MAG: hypothetical protein AAFV86_12470 [Pseudomonadota bacterium]